MSSGRGNRNTKDRTKNPGTPAQTKNEGPPNNIKPTPEQVRIAQIIRTDDNQESLMRQLMDMTQKSEEECALALHDCQNDVSRAALLLVEGNGDQGEWKEMGKKKKRQANHTQPPSKSDTAVDHHSEVPDSRRDRSRDMEAGDRPDKSDYPPRRGGRRSNGGPPPRLARGRARERGSFGDRIEDAEEKENGMGFNSRDRHGERGRGRGRGGQANRRGRGGSRTHRGGQGQRFEKGPHIDTWTNDQADSAENVPGWGETWNEDLGDDSWTGNLNETKVFTASTTKTSEEPTATTPPGNETPVPGQRVNVASLLPKLSSEKQMESFINEYNQQATESIKNSIGIGNDSSRQHYGHQASSVPNLMNSTSQSNSWATASPAAAVGTPTSTAAQACMHRPKPLKSKLPPPSKIPQSAVEMPGHQNVPPIDIHFGLDEGDSVPNFEFTVGGGSGSSMGTVTKYASALPSSNATSSNHVASQPPSAKVTAEAPAHSSAPASMISAPTSQAQPPALDQPPSRPDFQSSGFPTPKKEGPPTPAPANRMSPPADMTFPPSQQQEPKPGPMMPPPLAAAQPASHSQGSSAPVTEPAALVSYAQSTGSYSMPSYKSINSTQAYASTHTTNSQVGSYQNQFQSSPKTYGGSGGSQFQSGASQYPGSQQPSQYSSSQYPSSAGQNQFQGYQGGNVGSFQASGSGSSSLYQNPTPASSFQPASASYHSRDSQAGSGQPSTGSGFQGQGAGLSSPTSQAQGSYGAPAFSTAGHQPSLPSGGSSLTGSKLSDSLTKMTLKESAMDSHTTSQYDHSPSSTTSTGLTTTSTGALATGTTTVAAAVSTVSPAASSNSSRNSSNLPSAAASKLTTMPPGMQMPAAAAAAAVGAQYILGNPAFYGVQQPMYGFDEMMLQQRLPLSGNYYDHLPQYPVPTTLPGRDVPPLNVPYSASADNSKLTRVDAQSPNPTSQQSHNAPPQQAHYVPNYIYYQHMMPSAAPGFPQYQQVYPMPPVTNTAHAGSTATSQFQKNFSHGYSNKGYDDQTQGQDFAKTGYGGSQSQSKGSITSRSGASGDMAATGYGKTHPQQAFDKQGFHGGTPPPFNLPLAAASQATPMAAPNTPYGFMPVIPHQPPQPHSQMTLQHHPMQDSTPGSSRVGGSQGSSMGKAKGYGAYWNN